MMEKEKDDDTKRFRYYVHYDDCKCCCGCRLIAPADNRRLDEWILSAAIRARKTDEFLLVEDAEDMVQITVAAL